MKLGVAGRVARAFVDSKLTPLVIAASLALGALALLATPREEEPQIRVPMVDVTVLWPGADPQEVASRIVVPAERILYGVAGVEHVYSVARPGMALRVTGASRWARLPEEALPQRVSPASGQAPSQHARPSPGEPSTSGDSLSPWEDSWGSDAGRTV